MSMPLSLFDVILTHQHDDAGWVESLGKRLEDELGFRVWLDRWSLVPGNSWQQGMARGLNEAATCAVCIGPRSPDGWFVEEIERALNIQAQNPDFRVIPVLLPGASEEDIPEFLALRTWADFRDGQDHDYALHVLAQGIRGEPVGRWPLEEDVDRSPRLETYTRKLRELQHLSKHGLHEEVVVEFERKILSKWLEDGEAG